ncbi:MAG: LptE family protein [Cyclobacteriaceae bacterium]
MRKYSLIVLILALTMASGCGVYSFTGASISPDTRTISIQTFYNNAPLGPSNMSVLFTESIKDYFQQNTSLELVDQNGDLQIDGFISNYTVTPVAATSSGQADGVDFSALSRITITVNASYINLKDPTYDFEQNFSFFKDYDNSIDLSSNEEAFVEEIFDQIILDIFNASVANW